MPKFIIEDQNGKKVEIEGDRIPTQQEIEEIFAAIGGNQRSENYDVSGEIPERGRFSRPDEGYIQAGKTWLKNLFDPEKDESFRELPPGMRGLSRDEALAAARGEGPLPLRNSDPNAELIKDEYGNDAIRINGESFYFNRPGLGVNDLPGIASKTAGVVETAAPYLHGGIMTTSMKAGPAALVQAVIGLMDEGSRQTGNAIRGEDVDFSRLLTTPLLAAGGEVGGRALATGIGKIYKPALAKTLKESSDEALKVLGPGGFIDDALSKPTLGVAQNVDDMHRQALAEQLRRMDTLTPDEARRFELFDRYELTPTRANLTRNADDWQLQQETIKRSNMVRDAVEAQEGKLSSAFDGRVSKTGGRAAAENSSIFDAVTEKATMLDDEIRQLYKQANIAAKGEKAVRLENTVKALRENAHDDEISNGLIKAIKGELKKRGIIDKKWNVVGKIDVKTAEEIRQVINKYYDSTTGRGRSIIYSLKEAIDQDVFSFAGDDIYKAARQAKTSFERGLDTKKLSRFDLNKKSLVRDILENKTGPEDIFNRAVIGKQYNYKHLGELKEYLKDSPNAWKDLRAETLQWIKSKSFIGPEDAAGIRSLSRDKLEIALKTIGEKRLGVVFTKQEQAFLRNMLKIAKLREPVKMTQQGLGPSAQAISGLKKEVMSAIDTHGGLLEKLFSGLSIAKDGKIVLNNKVATTGKAIDKATAQAVARALSRPSSALAVGIEREGISR